MTQNLTTIPQPSSLRTLNETILAVAVLVHGPHKRAGTDVRDLEESFRAVGQLHPLIVRPKGESQFEVLAGNRRLLAAQNLGLETLRAVVFDGDEKLSDLVSIEENLARLALSKSERAEHLARQKALYELVHPETRHGGNRASGHGGHLKKSKKPTFAKKVAKATGESARALRRLAKVGESATPAVKKAWDAGKITDTQAEALAGKPANEQDEELARVITLPVTPVASQKPAAAGQPDAVAPHESLLGPASINSAEAALKKFQTDMGELLLAMQEAPPAAEGAVTLLGLIAGVRSKLDEIVLVLRPIAARQPVAGVPPTAAPAAVGSGAQ